MIELVTIDGNPAQRTALESVFEGSPLLSIASCSVIPPDAGPEDKFVFGVDSDGELIGCVNLVRNYPDRVTALVELLLLKEDSRGKGFGRTAFDRIEEVVSNWSGIEKMRLGGDAVNPDMIPFWEKMGFERVSAEPLVVEKKIFNRKRRTSMRSDVRLASQQLAVIPARTDWPEGMSVRTLEPTDGPLLGVLLDKAYRGTIDDERESVAQFIAEAKATLEGKYGPFVQDASFALVDASGAMISAAIISVWRQRPLLTYTATDPEHRAKGYATELILRTIRAMSIIGYRELFLSVTVGNDDAERLYRKLGFVEHKR